MLLGLYKALTEMSALGHEPTLQENPLMSASSSSPKADIVERRCQVRYVPKADIGAVSLASFSDRLRLYEYRGSSFRRRPGYDDNLLLHNSLIPYDGADET